jgi:phosphatidate phosphatase APP1
MRRLRAHAGRIDAIVIRDVTGEDRLSDRYRATFEGIDPVHWHILMPDTTAGGPQLARHGPKKTQKKPETNRHLRCYRHTKRALRYTPRKACAAQGLGFGQR